jgi:hypothetical protein
MDASLSTRAQRGHPSPHSRILCDPCDLRVEISVSSVSSVSPTAAAII